MRFFPALLCLLCLSLAASAVPAPAEKKAAAENLDGVWLCSAVDQGELNMPNLAGMLRMSFSGSKLTLDKKDENPPEKKQAEVRLDFSKKPAEIDILPTDGPFNGQAVPGIFERKGNTLKICAGNQPGGARPTAFKAAEGRIVITLTLQK